MKQVVLKINSKKEWDALKPFLEVMNNEYITQYAKMSERELELLRQAKDEKENGRVYAYSSHRGILGR